MKSRWIGLPFGAAFGFLLAWGHLTDPHVIRSMLLLREADVFLLMGSAMAVGAIGAHLLRALGARSLVGGEPITWTRTRPGRHHVVGSMIFGVGWSIACTCPGPIVAQLGSGHLAALFTAAGLLVGIGMRGWQVARAKATQARDGSTAAAGL